MTKDAVGETVQEKLIEIDGEEAAERVPVL